MFDQSEDPVNESYCACGNKKGIHADRCRQCAQKDLQKFEGNATRSVKDGERHLIPKSAIDALGRRLALGRKKHGKHNWKSGGPEFREETINHLLDHVFDYLENGNVTDSNTDAIICNAAFLCEFEVREPYKPKG